MNEFNKICFLGYKYYCVIFSNVFHSSRKIKGDFVDCEQVKYIIIDNGQYTYFIDIADYDVIYNEC